MRGSPLSEYLPFNKHRRFAAHRRAAMTIIVVLALAINLIASTYSGMVHAHEHVHEQSDHHHDEHNASDVDSSVDVASLEAGDTSGTRGLDQTHEHPADLALSMTPLVAWKFPVVDTSWSPSRSKAIVLFDVGPSERPPRCA